MYFPEIDNFDRTNLSFPLSIIPFHYDYENILKLYCLKNKEDFFKKNAEYYSEEEKSITIESIKKSSMPISKINFDNYLYRTLNKMDQIHFRDGGIFVGVNKYIIYKFYNMFGKLAPKEFQNASKKTIIEKSDDYLEYFEFMFKLLKDMHKKFNKVKKSNSYLELLSFVKYPDTSFNEFLNGREFYKDPNNFVDFVRDGYYKYEYAHELSRLNYMTPEYNDTIKQDIIKYEPEKAVERFVLYNLMKPYIMTLGDYEFDKELLKLYNSSNITENCQSATFSIIRITTNNNDVDMGKYNEKFYLEKMFHILMHLHFDTNSKYYKSKKTEKYINEYLEFIKVNAADVYCCLKTYMTKTSNNATGTFSNPVFLYPLWDMINNICKDVLLDNKDIEETLELYGLKATKFKSMIKNDKDNKYLTKMMMENNLDIKESALKLGFKEKDLPNILLSI